jgi:hypothetical protein
LAQGEAARRLWAESMFVDVLHGARILAAVRGALRPLPPTWSGA